MGKNSETLDLMKSKDKVFKDVRSFVTDTEELLHAVADFSGEKVAKARARVQDRVDEVKSLIEESQEAVLENAKEAVQTADEYVHQNPWQAVGIGMAVGFAIGLLARRP
jgi:ElaB/YqjD/DUF883 family membrane-anchored ribosome-binding protein